MIKNIIDLLQTSDYYGVSEPIDIAKGKYALPRTITETKNLIKRIWYGRQYNNI
jgi:hypothetical protein